MRFSRDLDYFHDSETRVAEAFSADRDLLQTSGYSIDVLDALHLHRHLLVLGALCWAACGKDPGSLRFAYWGSCDGVPHFGRPGGVLPRIVE